MELLLAPFEALEQSELGLSIRNAHLLYPIANVTHVICVIIFFALVASMDMAVLRRTPEEAKATIRRVRPFAFIAFFGVVGAGAVMFTAEASALVKNPAFLAKVTAIVVAGLNLMMFSKAFAAGRLWVARTSALLSMFVWIFAAAAGRGIAYL
ncbi:MAG: hypothetical protein ABWZ80_05910 [Beijerinckiaceae bacterium]